jgi:ketosteroid isomerase-like protein
VNTRETVHELLRRVAEGDPERIGQMFADEVDWKLDWPDGDYARTTPWIRHRSTRADAADNFREIAEHHVPGESDVRVHAVLVDGTEAVVLGEVAHTAKPTGRPYVAAFALHLTVMDGLIIRYHIYEDSLAVARAFDVV